MLAFILVATGCGGGEAEVGEDSQQQTSGGAETSPGDDQQQTASADTARIALANFPSSAVPWSGVGSPGQYIYSGIFDALTVISESGEAQPALAESWESVDETTWRFTLRDGVTFQNGEPFNADAVVASFNYLMSEEGKAQFAAHARNYPTISEVSAVDERTVEIKTASPDPLIPNAVSIVYIVPPEDWAEKGPEGFATAPVGTGPYQVTAWEPQRIEFERWEESWRDASIPNVHFLLLNDPAARVQALQSQQVDIVVSVSPDQIAELESAGFDGYVAPSGRLMSLAFITTTDGPLSSPQVRQALNYAVDKQAIAEQLVAGLTQPTAWPPDGVNGHDPTLEPYPYDPERAAELLEQAGYGDGFDFSAEVTLGAFPADREIYEAMAGYLSEVGVNVTLNEIDFAQDWLPKFSGQAEWAGEAFGSTWVAPPLMDAIRPFAWNSCGWPNEWFCDPEAEELINQVNATFDTQERDELLNQLLERNMENPPSLFLVELVELWALSPQVTGWQTHAFNPTWEELSIATG